MDIATGDTIVFYHIFIFEEELFQLVSEDNSDGSGGSDHLIVVIQITENWVCEYEAITVCEEAEDDSGETVCWTEWKLLRCYQVS